jgi:hypothetical protein
LSTFWYILSTFVLILYLNVVYLSCKRYRITITNQYLWTYASSVLKRNMRLGPLRPKNLTFMGEVFYFLRPHTRESYEYK